MNSTSSAVLAVFLLALIPGGVPAASHSQPQEQPASRPTQEELLKRLDTSLARARVQALSVVEAIVPIMEASNAQAQMPGITAWLNDYRRAMQGVDSKLPPSQWSAMDVEALTTSNPNFWTACYEIAPADPGFALLHASLMLANGEAARASYLLVIEGEHTGLPPETRDIMQRLLRQAQGVLKAAAPIVEEGVKHFDAGRYDEAEAVFTRLLEHWPQHGLARYELGLTRFAQDVAAAGGSLQAGVEVNPKVAPSAEVQALYARARRHDPLEAMAYQGSTGMVEPLIAIAEKVQPSWEQLGASWGTPDRVPDAVLMQFCEGLQTAGVHDLALAAHQVIVARRGRWIASDHPVIVKSVRALIPGERAEAIAQRLAGAEMEVVPLMEAEVGKPAQNSGGAQGEGN